jgi:hypothetical protein
MTALGLLVWNASLGMWDYAPPAALRVYQGSVASEALARLRAGIEALIQTFYAVNPKDLQRLLDEIPPAPITSNRITDRPPNFEPAAPGAHIRLLARNVPTDSYVSVRGTWHGPVSHVEYNSAAKSYLIHYPNGTYEVDDKTELWTRFSYPDEEGAPFSEALRSYIPPSISLDEPAAFESPVEGFVEDLGNEALPPVDFMEVRPRTAEELQGEVD